MSRPRSQAPILFAHRGASGLAPENTVEAFRLALELGATGLESDVHLAADGTPVLVHDPVVEADGRTVVVRASSVEALRELGVPALTDLYDACGNACPLSLDLNDERAVQAGLALARVARSLGGPEAVANLFLCHGELDVLRAVGIAAPGAILVHSAEAGVLDDLDGHLARLRAAGVGVLNLHHSSWGAHGAREAIGRVHAAGLLAFAWDTQTQAEARSMLDAGADAVYADDPRVLVAAATSAPT